jgi:hypothetical protein
MGPSVFSVRRWSGRAIVRVRWVLGPSHPLSTAQPCPYVIELTATDRKGYTSALTIGVFIGSRMYLPMIMK